MNIDFKDRFATDYDVFTAIEEAVKDDEIDFCDFNDIADHDPDLVPHLQKKENLVTAFALMRRHKQQDRIEKLLKIYPEEIEASTELIWSIKKVTRNHLMANELIFLKIDPSRSRLKPIAFYQIRDKESPAYGEIRPLFSIPDEVFLMAFLILPYNDQLNAIEQADRETLSAKLIELLTTLSKKHKWPISDQFKNIISWSSPGASPTRDMHNALYEIEESGADTYIQGHVISSYLDIEEHKIVGLKGNPPVEECQILAESICVAFAKELTKKPFKPSEEEQEQLQKEADQNAECDLMYINNQDKQDQQSP